MSKNLAIILGVCLCGTPAWSSEIPWKTPVYVHVANSQPLVDLLRIFSADQGISTVISEKVTGKVSGKFGPMQPEKFLNELTATNGLIWYYDGQSLHINRSDEATSRIIRLQRAEAESVLSTLKGLGIDGGRFPIKILPDAHALYVTGPPRFLDLVTQLTATLEEGAEAPADPTMGIGIYPLKYAWADDHSVMFRNEQVIIPGVATMLRNLLGGQAPPQSSVGRDFRPLPLTLEKLKGQGMIKTEKVEAELEVQKARDADRAQSQPGPMGQGAQRQPGGDAQQIGAAISPGALVQADRRLNAVIIRDTRGKLSAYEEAIKALDRPVGLVEITAAIIDINTSSGFQWGPPYLTKWRYNGNDNTFAMSIDPNGAQVTGTGPTAVFPAGQANFTATLIAGGALQFMQQMEALETCGLANIQSRPSVLTIDNIEAMLSRVESYYVRVNGNLEVDLFNVSAGTTLKVMPHIIYNDDGTRKIKLLVDLQDGTIDIAATAVEGLPRTTQNAINTQAVLRENESLLVGGLFNENITKTESAIPILSKAPLVGFLFKSINNTTVRNERVILLTPRIVDLDTLPLEPPPGNLMMPPPPEPGLLPGRNSAPGPGQAPSPGPVPAPPDPAGVSLAKRERPTSKPARPKAPNRGTSISARDLPNPQKSGRVARPIESRDPGTIVPAQHEAAANRSGRRVTAPPVLIRPPEKSKAMSQAAPAPGSREQKAVGGRGPKKNDTATATPTPQSSKSKKKEMGAKNSAVPEAAQAAPSNPARHWNPWRASPENTKPGPPGEASGSRRIPTGVAAATVE